MRRILVLASFAILPWAPNALPAEAPNCVRGEEVIREMNKARQHPEVYADYLEEWRAHFKGRVLVRPGRPMMRTREGVGAIAEAIRFLRKVPPRSPLTFSPGISLAAAEHVVDQAGGALGHRGSDRSNPAQRMNRYGTWSTLWGENVSYGKRNAREIVLALIVDDGLRSRKHRKTIFNPDFHFAGAAAGPHPRYGTVCSIDFAAGYVERGAEFGSLIARN